MVGAERRRTIYRYALGQQVYLAGSHEPFTVKGQKSIVLLAPIATDPPSEHRELHLQGRVGPGFWINEELIHPGPPRRSNGP